jgi:hypothetical protein
MTKKSKVVWVGSTPIVRSTAKERTDHSVPYEVSSLTM